MPNQSLCALLVWHLYNIELLSFWRMFWSKIVSLALEALRPHIELLQYLSNPFFMQMNNLKTYFQIHSIVDLHS